VPTSRNTADLWKLPKNTGGIIAPHLYSVNHPRNILLILVWHEGSFSSPRKYHTSRWAWLTEHRQAQHTASYCDSVICNIWQSIEFDLDYSPGMTHKPMLNTTIAPKHTYRWSGSQALFPYNQYVGYPLKEVSLFPISCFWSLWSDIYRATNGPA
jgi:hypothetical protein